MNTQTQTTTGTYTVVDIRKTFEGFSADLRMIGLRTGKKSLTEVEDYLHDILLWAESKYLIQVDITLIDMNEKPIQAARYKVDEQGKSISSERPGNNLWSNIPGSRLMVIVTNSKSWWSLSEDDRLSFMKANQFKLTWGRTSIDTSYSHLSKSDAQLYASKGYELKKENYK